MKNVCYAPTVILQSFSGYDWMKAVYPPAAFVKFCRDIMKKAAEKEDTERGEEEEGNNDEDKVSVEIICRNGGVRLTEEIHKIITTDKKVLAIFEKLEKHVVTLLHSKTPADL